MLPSNAVKSRDRSEWRSVSARAFDRIVKAARTIADMAGADLLGAAHISEAIQYRPLDHLMWL